MKWNTLAFLWALQAASAQRWEVRDCDAYKPDVIRSAMKEAINIAKDAVSVLNEQGGDEKIKGLVKSVLGEDDWEAKLAKAKGHLEGVASYDTTETTGLLDDATQRTNKDVGVLCDMNHWVFVPEDPDAGTESVLLNTYTQVLIGFPEGDENLQAVQLCHDKTMTWPPGTRKPAMFTCDSDDIDYAAYNAAKALAEAPGSNLAPPNQQDYSVPQEQAANTIDVCGWWLTPLLAKGGFETLSDDFISKVQLAGSIFSMQPGVAPIDMITKSIPGNLLHELSHTTLGGQTEDIDFPNCYGWVCVTAQKNPDNADTVEVLGVTLHLFKRGYNVDKDGKVTKM